MSPSPELAPACGRRKRSSNFLCSVRQSSLCAGFGSRRTDSIDAQSVYATDVTAAEVRKLRGLLSALPPGDRGPLACLAGLHVLHEAMQDHQLALQAHDDTEVRVCSVRSS